MTVSHYLIEPSAGNGVFVREMRKAWPQSSITAIEIRPEVIALGQTGASAVHQGDWVAWVRSSAAFWPTQPSKQVLMIGNPPFSLAQAHLEESFKYLPVGSEICFLLRFSFFGGKQRNIDFWLKAGGQFLKHVIPIAPRPSFVKGTSDNSEYAIFIWRVGHVEKATVLRPLLWEKRTVRPKE